VLHALGNLVQAVREQGRLDEAETLGKRHNAECVRLLGSENGGVSAAKQALWMRRSAGKHEEALEIVEENHANLKRMHGPEHMQTLECVVDTVTSLMRLKRYEEADARCIEYIPILRRVAGPEHMLSLAITGSYARCLAMRGHLVEAEVSYAKNHAMLKRVFGSEHKITLATFAQLDDIRDSIAGKPSCISTLLRKQQEQE
jgi:hypothetical protein